MTTRFRLSAVLFLALLTAGTVTAQSDVNRRHTETLLGPFPPEVRQSAVLSPDGRHVAYIQSGAGQRVVVDGKEQKPYDQVAGLEFNHDGSRLAYAAKRDDRWYVVVDGRESPGYRRVGVPHFNADGTRLAHVALLDVDKRTVVVNGQAGQPYDVISAGLIEFSPDGSRMAYGGVRDGKCYLIVDGDETGPFDDLGTRTGYQFSSDNARLAFVALVGENLHVILDGRRSPPAYDVGDLVFSPDGKQVAYTAQEAKDGPWFVFQNNEKQGPYQTIGDKSLRFSPDSSRLAYSAQTEGRWTAVVDRQPGEPHDGIAEMRFSPDGKRLAYVVQDGETEAVVVDGKLERCCDAIGGGSLVFSPDSRTLGYIARSGYARFVVIGGMRKPRYTMVAYLNFSSDSRYYAYIALDNTGAFTVVDDLRAAHRYESVWNPPDEKLLFDYRDQFHYIAIKEEQVFLVEEKIE
jgi:dipeptidyl aminopeptidase/acylaminoacyl peptidase